MSTEFNEFIDNSFRAIKIIKKGEKLSDQDFEDAVNKLSALHKADKIELFPSSISKRAYAVIHYWDHLK